MRRLVFALAAASLLAGCPGPGSVPPASGTSAAGRLAAEAAMTLQAGAETRLRLQPDPAAAKGTLVMYHGFSAGTWQYDLLGEQLFARGYNLYVPRLPGHGRKRSDGREDSSRLPTGSDWTRYQAFAEETYAEAAALGAPVSVLGLSVGGNVALYVAEQHPEVQRTVLYAPFLRHRSVSGVFDNLRLGGANFVLDRLPFGWGEGCEAESAAGKRPGHCSFVLGNVQGVLSLGREVIARAETVSSPIQLFVTAVDDVSDEDALWRVYRAAGGAPKHGWYYYPESEGIPHPMLHPMEDKGKGHTPKLYEMTQAFLESGEPIQRAKPGT